MCGLAVAELAEGELAVVQRRKLNLKANVGKSFIIL
jgi:hypothetical protein